MEWTVLSIDAYLQELENRYCRPNLRARRVEGGLKKQGYGDIADELSK